MERPKPIKNVPTESALLGVLFILRKLDLFKKIDSETKLGRPYVYSNITILCCFVVMLWMRLGSVNSLCTWLSADYRLNTKAREACGLKSPPDRRTLDRRFARLPFEELISSMGYQFVIRRFVNAVIVAIDSTIAMDTINCRHDLRRQLGGIKAADNAILRPGTGSRCAI